MNQTMAKAKSDRIYRRSETFEVSFGFHTNNTLAVRAAIPTQKNTFIKAVKECRYKSMAPYAYGSASGALLRFTPIIISPFFINFVEKN
jgi:hypothetical protein